MTHIAFDGVDNIGNQGAPWRQHYSEGSESAIGQVSTADQAVVSDHHTEETDDDESDNDIQQNDPPYPNLMQMKRLASPCT